MTATVTLANTPRHAHLRARIGVRAMRGDGSMGIDRVFSQLLQ